MAAISQPYWARKTIFILGHPEPSYCAIECRSRVVTGYLGLEISAANQFLRRHWPDTLRFYLHIGGKCQNRYVHCWSSFCEGCRILALCFYYVIFSARLILPLFLAFCRRVRRTSRPCSKLVDRGLVIFRPRNFLFRRSLRENYTSRGFEDSSPIHAGLDFRREF